MKLKSLEITDFKGVSHANYVFDGKSAVISGMNGQGKTTIADAFYFLFADRDYSLVKNPSVFPLNKEEAEPKVTAIVEIDGVEHILSKWKERKVSKEKDGTTKVSYNNMFSKNEVPMSATKFKEFFNDVGIDIDKFTEFSHPDMFTSLMDSKKDRDAMRTMLFKMASSYSDLEIAQMDDSTKDVAALLEKYSLEEIKALHESTKKKSVEQVDSIPDQILGMEKTKVSYDMNALEKEKSELTAKIEELKSTIDSDNRKNLIKNLEQQKFELQFEINDCKRRANEKILSDLKAKEKEIDDAESNVLQFKRYIERVNHSIETLKSEIDDLEVARKKAGADYNLCKQSVLDENSKVCSCCGQTLPEDKISEIVSNFEKNKQERLASLIKLGTQQKKSIEAKRIEVSEYEEEVKSHEQDLLTAETTLNLLKDELAQLPKEADMMQINEWIELNSKDEELAKAINDLQKEDVDTSEIESEISDYRSSLKEVEEKIFLLNKNASIDKMIEELRAQQLKAEQSKADAERILHQIDLVSRKKNELLSDAVNSHFELVDFIFFDYLKNGSYIEVCIPTVDGKRLGESMNTGLELMAKIDIVKGLQKFFGVELPVFVDGAECFDMNSFSDLVKQSFDMQIVALKVSNDDIKVEVL